MISGKEAPVIYKFERFRLNIDRRELWRGDDLVAVEPQVFDLIQHLIQNRERVVSKDDLIEHVWNGRNVSDSTLTSRITAARHAIGDTGEDQRLIRTIPRKGIRFVGEVQEGTQKNANGAHAGLSAAPRLPDKPSIAVLPFINMSGDPEQEYFSDGITEDIVAALSRLRWFFVIARNSTLVYKSHAIDLRQVGRELGIRYVLEGSVRRSGQRIRVSAQLLDAIHGSYIWSEKYDRELTDIFALQDEITASVTSAIEPKLLAAEGLRTETRSAEDLDAWDMVARALSHFWKLTAPDSAAAIAILRQTVQLYPNYAPAHSMLAFALFMSVYVGWIPPGTDGEFAARLASRAVELDDGDPWVHLALGYYAATRRQTDEAVRHFRDALDLNPNFALATGSIGFVFSKGGRSADAIPHFEQALRMSPRDPFNSFVFVGLAVAHYMADRFDDAVKSARQAVQLRPGYIGAHRILCASLAQAGEIDEAKAIMVTLRKLQPDISITCLRQSLLYTPEPMERFLEGMRKAGLK
jgi:TolB-like protein